MAYQRLTDVKVERWLTSTEKAWLFQINGKRVWVPKSIGEFDEASSELTLPEEWAIDKELV